MGCNDKNLRFEFKPPRSPFEERMRQEHMARITCDHVLSPPVAVSYAARADLFMAHQNYLFEALQKNEITFTRVSTIVYCCTKCRELMDSTGNLVLNASMSFYCSQLLYKEAYLAEPQIRCRHEALELAFFDESFERAYCYGNESDCDIYCNILALQMCATCGASVVTDVSARDVMERNAYEGRIHWFVVSKEFLPLALKLRKVPEKELATRPIRNFKSTWHMPRD